MMSFDKLLFMHIPKTAGSSMNAYLESQFPPEQSILHLENQVFGVPMDQLPSFDDKNSLSAHLHYPTLNNIIDIKQFFTMTVLRDPLDQTLSHLGWMNRLGFAENKEELARYPDYIKHIVNRLHAMDLVSYFDTMDEHEKNFFDNCQTRYLLPVYGETELSEAHLEEAIANLQKFNLVGILEKFEQSLLLLAYYMNWRPPKKMPYNNPSRKKYFLDMESAGEEIKDRVHRLTRFDQKLYDAALEMFEHQKQKVFEELTREYPEFISSSGNESQQWEYLSKLQNTKGKKAVYKPKQSLRKKLKTLLRLG